MAQKLEIVIEGVADEPDELTLKKQKREELRHDKVSSYKTSVMKVRTSFIRAGPAIPGIFLFTCDHSQKLET